MMRILADLNASFLTGQHLALFGSTGHQRGVTAKVCQGTSAQIKPQIGF